MTSLFHDPPEQEECHGQDGPADAQGHGPCGTPPAQEGDNGCRHKGDYDEEGGKMLGHGGGILLSMAVISSPSMVP